MRDAIDQKTHRVIIVGDLRLGRIHAIGGPPEVARVIVH
jgi:hypothetical protein